MVRLKQRFYWVGCQPAVADWIANCNQCIAAKGPVKITRNELQQITPEYFSSGYQ